VLCNQTDKPFFLVSIQTVPRTKQNPTKSKALEFGVFLFSGARGWNCREGVLGLGIKRECNAVMKTKKKAVLPGIWIQNLVAFVWSPLFPHTHIQLPIIVNDFSLS
jgi:hypothetical protein